MFPSHCYCLSLGLNLPLLLTGFLPSSPRFMHISWQPALKTAPSLNDPLKMWDRWPWASYCRAPSHSLPSCSKRKPMTFPYMLCVLFSSLIWLCVSYLSLSHLYLSPVLQPQHLLTLTYQNNFFLFCALCLDHHPADTEWLPPSPAWTLLADDTLLVMPIQTTLLTVSVPVTPPPLASFLFLCPHHSHFLTYFGVNCMFIAHLSRSKT